jgi:hypothetical protein
MKLNLDPWQKEILETKDNILLCSGRQVGKSTIIAVRDGELAAKQKKESILIIAPTERQSEEIFNKTFFYLLDNYPKLICTGKDKPTKHVIKLKNGSIIRCLPTGLNGSGIRGFTITKLTVEEAAYIGEEVWAAVTPMLLTTGGKMDLLGTPFGKKLSSGDDRYFYSRYKNLDNFFKVFNISTEDVIKERELSATWTLAQREQALKHLESEKQRMSHNQYLQEYCGVFVEENKQYFTEKSIIEAVKGNKRPEKMELNKNYFMGVDIARMGDDASTFEIGYTDDDVLIQTENLTTRKTLTTETEDKIIELTKKYNLKKVYIDAGSGSLGVGIFDHLLKEPTTSNKVVAINNRARALDNDDKKTTRILKEDLYDNLRRLMERHKIKLLEDDDLISSLKSIQYEYVKDSQNRTRIRIFSDNNHIAEGLTRLAECLRNPPLNLWCGYSGHPNIN